MDIEGGLKGGAGGKGERQWVGNSNFNSKASSFCRNFRPSISFFIHSFTFSSYFLPFLQILRLHLHPSLLFFYYLFLSLSHLIQLSSFPPFILAACSSKSDFYTTNWFPISICVLCKKIRCLSFGLHSRLGRRNLIAGVWYIPHA